MNAFPFSEAEWAAMNNAATSIVNASLADDAALRESLQIELLDVLEDLRIRHGKHPVLLETEADFAEDYSERRALYAEAARLAAEHGLPTLGIRLSLARLLIDAGEWEAARLELLACCDEVSECDDADRATWAELFAGSQ